MPTCALLILLEEGGVHGHLSLLMSADKYLLLSGSPFEAPQHPGDAPTHAVNATISRITETNRQYHAALREITTYRTVHAKLKQQILTAVPDLYLNSLEDDLMGYADVDAVDMIEHLDDRYAKITPDKIENNRQSLSLPWNPDTKIEDLWLRITTAQLFATNAGIAIPDDTAIFLTLQMFEKEQLFTMYCDTWRDMEIEERTLPKFKIHFEKANKGRLRKLTADRAGYHGAANAAIDNNDNNNGRIQVNGGCNMYYCWTHGLGKNRSHTSTTCTNPDEGHQRTATADNMQGGNNRIMTGRRNND